jgi:hypothetical protein
VKRVTHRHGRTLPNELRANASTAATIGALESFAEALQEVADDYNHDWHNGSAADWSLNREASLEYGSLANQVRVACQHLTRTTRGTA